MLICLILMATTILLDNARQCWATFAANAAAPSVRPLKQFLEEEFVLSDGEHAGQHFRADRQPFARLWLDLYDNRLPQWNHFALTGCVQSGKTIIGFTGPAMHALCEMRETIILGSANEQTLKDKWNVDLLTALKASRYAELLPTSGPGSKDGWAELITLKNGAAIKFMSTGGGDIKTSAFTSRHVFMTELDRFDRSKEASREASGVDQMAARTFGFEDRAQTWGECTVTTEDGAIWTMVQSGTCTAVTVQCKSCRQWSTPERKHLVGWQDQTNKIAAGDAARFICPHCAVVWSDADRFKMNHNARLLHRGQTIDEGGNVSGHPEPTDLLSFRWNAFNNLFWSTSYIARHEWEAEQKIGEQREEAEKKMCQWFWVVPVKRDVEPLAELTVEGLATRIQAPPRGIAPNGTTVITGGVDVHKRHLEWSAIAWPSGQIIAYGKSAVPWQELPLSLAIRHALAELRDQVFFPGFAGESGGIIYPDCVWVDNRYQGDAVNAFIRDSQAVQREKLPEREADIFWACLGFGADKRGKYARYKKPKNQKKVDDGKLVMGRHYHVEWDDEEQLWICHVDANTWKETLQLALEAPMGEDESMTVHAGTEADHQEFFEHLSAEKQEFRWVPELGWTLVYVQVRKQNHWLDSTYIATAASHWCGIEWVKERRAQKQPPADVPGVQINITTPDGRPFLAEPS